MNIRIYLYNNDAKKHPKNDRILDRFVTQVGYVLGPKLGPKSRSRRSQNAPKTLPRRHQDSPRATRAPKIEIWSIFGPNVRWGTPLASILKGCWPHFVAKFWPSAVAGSPLCGALDISGRKYFQPDARSIYGRRSF